MKKYFIIAVLIATANGCVKPFVAAPQKADNSFLVIDGLLNANGQTVIRLSRTRNLSDTVASSPENGAQVFIQNESGGSINFTSTNDGEYTSQDSLLNTGLKYRLRIVTSNSKEYLSDYLEVRQTPDIDSLHWEQHDDIFVYVNTHDPSNQSKYYRWEFSETSEYHAVYESVLDYINGTIVFLPDDSLRSVCYKTFNSTDILIGSSASLANDVINQQLLQKVPNDNSKISYRYSINVKQYVLTPEAYQFWTILKQNSEETGSIFGPQPSQLKSNIHCTSVPDEPVVGFLSASTVTTKRIFIRNLELVDRKDQINTQCQPIFINDPDSIGYYLNDHSRLPAYFVSGGTLAVANNICVDCRLQGGVTKKPSFW